MGSACTPRLVRSARPACTAVVSTCHGNSGEITGVVRQKTPDYGTNLAWVLGESEKSHILGSLRIDR